MGEIAINPTHNVHQKYRQMNLVNPYRFGSGFDLDAQAFITSAVISDSIQKSAINTLVIALKEYGLWSKFKAIYPIIGGSEYSHKWNLKDPRDLDSAFRLIFTSTGTTSITHNSSGINGNGGVNGGGAADTFINSNTNIIASDNHLSNYCISDTNGAIVDIGQSNHALYQRFNNNAYSDNSASNRISAANTTSLGFYIGTRTSITSHKLYKNGSILKSSTASSSTALLSSNILLMRSGNSSSYFSNRTYSFFTIGSGLNDEEAANLYTIVQAYQTTLGRQV